MTVSGSLFWSPARRPYIYLYIHINKNFLCQQGWLTDDWRQPSTLWSPWQGCKVCLLKEGNIETEIIPRWIVLVWIIALNWSTEKLRLQLFLQLVLMSYGQKRDVPVNHCKSKKPNSWSIVKNLRGLSLVRASVSRVFKWMRRGYWLPIDSLRVTEGLAVQTRQFVFVQTGA